jgi:hypothetical protein
MAYTTINKGSLYMNTVLNTGDNTSPKSITGVGFQPDWVWTKTRNNTNNHTLFDSVRGAGVAKELSSDTTAGEGGVDTTNYGYLSSFDSDGFTATTGAIGINYYNATGSNYVNWNWKAGGTASSNTDGTITSSVSASTTAGFSVVSYTGTGSAGATVGHGLGVTPQVIIVKNRDFADVWVVGHHKLNNGTNPFNYEIYLNLSSGEGAASGAWNNTSPTSSFFTVGSGNVSNKSGDGIVAYCFAEKQGFSKFDSYVGNGSTDGTFIYTGFRPSFFLYKSTASGESWQILDIDRNTYNGIDGQVLRPDLTNAEVSSSATKLDFLSNGFKWRSNDAGHNGSGTNYIYMAFAENPFVGSDGTPVTAR